MPAFELATPDGQKYRIDAADGDAARAAFDSVFNPPPAGVMIHDPGRSYITPDPNAPPGTPPPPSVDTRGMAPWVGSNLPFQQEQKSGLPNREEAAAALAMRQRGGEGAIMPRTLQPFVQGATMGFGDEAASAAAALGSMVRGGAFDKAYSMTQEAQRQDLAQTRQENPWTSTAAQIGGSLITAPLAGALGLGRVAAGTAPLGARILGGAGLGAGYGAVSGFGEGSGLEDRLTKMVPGAAGGLLVGGAVPLAGEAVRRGANYLLDRGTIGRNLRDLGVDRPAGDAVMRTLEADAAFQGGPGNANLVAAGPQGMLADVGSATQGLLDTAVRKGGAGSLPVRQALEQRGQAAHDQLTDVLDAALGPPQGLQTATQAINTAGRAGRQTAYDLAYNTPIDYSASAAQDLQTLLQRVPGDVINTANRLMQLGGHQSRQIQATIDEAGNVAYQRLPDVRQIDYITRAMRQLAESQQTTGALGRATPLSQAYSDLAGDVRRTTRSLVPEYGTALDTAADDIGRIQATRFGANILSPAVTRDEVAQGLARHNASAPEMAQVRAGLRSQIDDTMANVRAIASNPNQDIQETARILGNLNSRATQDKLDMVITDPLMRQQVRDQLDQATRAIQLRANMTTNSKTFGLTAQEEAKRAMLEPGPIGAAARGQPVDAMKRAIQTLTGRTPQYDVSREDAMNRQIAELLTVARGPAAQQQLDRLRQAYTVGPQNAARAQEIGGMVGLAGLPGYQALRSLLGY